MAGAPKGNTNAANGKIWSDAVRKAITQGKKLDSLATKLILMALDGDMTAMKEIGDRLEGKPAQSLHVDSTQRIIRATDLTDTELASIASGSGEGTSKQKDGTKELH